MTEIHKIADRQNWTDTTLLNVVLDALSGTPMFAVVQAEVQRRANAENQRHFEVEVVFKVIAKDEPEAIHRVENQLAILTEGHDYPVFPWTIDERGTVEVESPAHEPGTLGAYLHGPDVPVGAPCPDHPTASAHSEHDTTTGRRHV